MHLDRNPPNSRSQQPQTISGGPAALAVPAKCFPAHLQSSTEAGTQLLVKSVALRDGNYCFSENLKGWFLLVGGFVIDCFSLGPGDLPAEPLLIILELPEIADGQRNAGGSVCDNLAPFVNEIKPR
jgi:hypothetical protein